MGDITVKNKGGDVLYTINVDNTGKVTGVDKPAGSEGPMNASTVYDALQGAKLDDSEATWQLDKLLGTLGAVVLEGKDLSGAEGDKAAKRLEALNDAVANLKNQIAAEKGKSPADAGKIATLENAHAMAKKQLSQLFGQMDAHKDKLSDSAKNIMQSVKSSPDFTDPAPATPAPGSGKAQYSSSPAPQAAAAQQPQYPGAGKAAGAPGGNVFDLNKVLQSSMFQTMNLNSMDTLGKSQMDQKKMMMLFMYFAMQAMSGDIGAMTAFMQFITTIITKDKAMQNVNMANKLIELEDASRKATNELLETPSYDPNNQQVGADFSKTMEKVKADQGSIATSQKLIAQMMEEFAQVSEFLNNLQKSLLDVRGRILSRSSSFNS